MAMISFEGDDAAWLHTCLSAKTYFKFTQDHANSGGDQIDEPSSDDNNTNKETEVLQQVQTPRCLHRPSQAQESSFTVPTASTPASAPIPTQQASNMSANHLWPRGSFPFLKSVPPKIWASNWVPSPGHYRGQITLMSLLIRYSHIPFYFHFSITFPTLLIHHYAPLLMWPHTTTHNTRLHFNRPVSLIWWTDVLQFTCFISILSSPMCALLQPDQSQILTPCSQALTIASLWMSLVLTFLLTICI